MTFELKHGSEDDIKRCQIECYNFDKCAFWTVRYVCFKWHHVVKTLPIIGILPISGIGVNIILDSNVTFTRIPCILKN